MKSKGIFLTILSAIIFGFTPIIAKITYDLGSNGITLAFLRHAMVIPILYGIIKLQKVSLHITKTQLKNILLVGIFGSGLAILTLYSSYSYISVGSATVLHFLYPMFVSLLSLVFFKEKLSRVNKICLAIATLGIVFFMEPENGSMFGVILSLVSGIFFAYYVVGIDRLWLKDMNSYVLNFYFAVFISIFIAIFGLLTNTIEVSLSYTVYGYSFMIAILTSIIGIICLQQGVRYLGGTTASILSMFEPVTSVIVSMIILHEQLSVMKLIGCCIILFSITLIVITKGRK